MSRPKPTVLLQHSNKTTFKMDEVLAAEGIWAVFYDGKPINLKSSSLVANYPGLKYKKVSLSNPGHAENLEKKLNVQKVRDKLPDYKWTSLQDGLKRAVEYYVKEKNKDY